MLAGFIWLTDGPVADSCNAVMNLRCTLKSGTRTFTYTWYRAHKLKKKGKF